MLPPAHRWLVHRERHGDRRQRAGPVWLYAWPSAAVVRSLRPGQKVPLTVLGEQTTSTGRYTISVSPGALPGRIVNMEVTAFAGGAMTARSFTRRRVAGSGRTVLAMPFGPAQTAPQAADLRLRPAAPDDPCPYGGTLFYKRNLDAKYVVVGATYSKARNITARFSYLSAQTGYDQGAQFSYSVTGNPGRWMCGKTNNPGGSNPPAGLVVAY